MSRNPRVRDEIRFHRDRLIEDFVAAGMSREEAERRAFLEFGNAAAIEEQVRDVRGRVLDDFAKDLRYAVRTLRRHPAFSAVAVLSLALGIGANVAVFSLVNAVMLQSLPVEEPDRLIQITRITPEGRPGVVSYPLFELFRDNVQSISGAFAQRSSEMPAVIDGESEFVMVDAVSAEYYDLLGLEPALGRLLTANDDSSSAMSPAAVISDGYWQRRFGRNPFAIGKTVAIAGRLFTVVGVTPASYRGARTDRMPDITVPLIFMVSDMQRRSSDFNMLNVIGRLKSGGSVEQANAEVQVLFEGFAQAQAMALPEKDRAQFLRRRAAALPAPDGINPFRGEIGGPLLIVMGIVALILLLACVNLAGLLLARAAARQREISIRLAIGAGRGRLVRQLLTETVVLAVFGGAVALVLANWLSGTLFALFTADRSVALSVSPDWRVLAFTAAVSLLACVVAGLVPALHGVRVSLNPALKEVRAHGHGRLGKALVVVQLSISMVLIVGATLFVGTLVKLYTVERGFDSDRVLMIQLRASRPIPPARALALHVTFVERLGALPDVQAASAAQLLPATGGLWDRRVQVEGYSFRPDELEGAGFNAVAPGYFATIGTRLVSGREFTNRDTPPAPKVAIVNEAFERYFFGGASALGRHVTSVGITYEIVGVVRDAKYQSLRDAMLKTVYIASTQREGEGPDSYGYVARVAAGNPERLVPAVERLARDVDPALRVYRAVAYSTAINRVITTERMMALLGGVFGLLALVIAAIGVFGVVAFQVTRRTNELGVRMALGANRWSMVRLVLRDVAWMVVTGVVMGGAAALSVTGLARTMLFGLTPTDPGVFALAALVLAVAAGLAAWLPARRAARVDPLVALRHE
jgi:predicted permease